VFHVIGLFADLPINPKVEQLAGLFCAKYGFLCPDWNRIETVIWQYNFNTETHKLDDAVFGMEKRSGI
jgi:hypothetical protein